MKKEISLAKRESKRSKYKPDLSMVADRVNAIARRAEHLITGRDKARRYLALFEEGKDTHLNLLLAAQACGDAGLSHPDMAFATICRAADEIAVEAAGADPSLERLVEKLKAAIQEQGAAFDPDNVETWSEATCRLSDEIDRRWDEACEQHIVAILRRHGEDGIADLYLSDNDAYWCRWRAGVRLVAADNPEVLAILDEWEAREAEAQGDTPTSEVVPEG
jgi:hypothetical protein